MGCRQRRESAEDGTWADSARMQRANKREQSGGDLCRALERDEGQMPPTTEGFDLQDHLRQLGIRSCRSPRRRARTSADIERCSASQRLMGSMRIVPLDVDGQFPPHVPKPEGDDCEGPDALGLQGADEAFDNRDAPISAHGAVARPDAAAAAPSTESAALELRAAIGDQVSRRLTDGANRSAEERPHLFGGGRAEEDGMSDRVSGGVVQGDGDPVTEGPDLRKGVRKPRDPQPRTRGDDGQVHVPDVVGMPCRHDASGGRHSRRRRQIGRRTAATEHPAGDSGAQAETRAGQHVGQPPPAHRRAQRLQPLHDEARELGKRFTGEDRRTSARSPSSSSRRIHDAIVSGST